MQEHARTQQGASVQAQDRGMALPYTVELV